MVHSFILAGGWRKRSWLKNSYVPPVASGPDGFPTVVTII
jgi:hypothetical protein